MVKLASETTIILDDDDMNKILTDAICGYGTFGDLRATIIKENAEGDFVVTLNPKPPEDE